MHIPPQINKTTWLTVVFALYTSELVFHHFQGPRPRVFPIALVKRKKKVRIQFTYFGSLNMGQFVVTQSGLLIPQGLVAANGAVRFPGEDTIESGSA